jgi:hypothetical protein
MSNSMSDPRDRKQADPASGRLARVRQVARFMDDAVRIPGLGVRVGADALIGLIPGVGDVAGAVVGGWMVVSAARLGASRPVLIRMLANLGVDALLGAVPLLGDLFDVGFKANRRNLRLLEAHVADPRDTDRRSRRLVTFALGGVIALIAALLVLVGWVLAVVGRALVA